MLWSRKAIPIIFFILQLPDRTSATNVNFVALNVESYKSVLRNHLHSCGSSVCSCLVCGAPDHRSPLAASITTTLWNLKPLLPALSRFKEQSCPLSPLAQSQIPTPTPTSPPSFTLPTLPSFPMFTPLWSLLFLLLTNTFIQFQLVLYWYSRLSCLSLNHSNTHLTPSHPCMQPMYSFVAVSHLLSSHFSPISVYVHGLAISVHPSHLPLTNHAPPFVKHSSAYTHPSHTVYDLSVWGWVGGWVGGPLIDFHSKDSSVNISMPRHPILTLFCFSIIRLHPCSFSSPTPFSEFPLPLLLLVP